jgi:hypothetical protein
MPVLQQGGWSDFGSVLAAVSALGTAAFGMVDATKVYRGGVSNIGLGFIVDAVKPYEAALQLVNVADPYATIRGNWRNGVAKADQKATVKSLIRLGLTPDSALSLAAGAPGSDPATLQTAAAKIHTGQALTEQDINALGRFDAIVDAQMDAAFEHADQSYRNSAKVIAAAFAIVLALVGVWAIEGAGVTAGDLVKALFVGILATPLAPVAKDITTALGHAVTALKSVRG